MCLSVLGYSGYICMQYICFFPQIEIFFSPSPSKLLSPKITNMPLRIQDKCCIL